MKFGLFSDFNLKIKLKPSVDNFIFRLHYRFTYVFFMGCVGLTTLYDIIGDKIKCLSASKIPKFGALVNSYCFIMGTFTVDKHHYNGTLGVDVPHPGIGPFNEENDKIQIHSYYQWVPFFLFLMGVLFYLPHWQWKVWEGGLFNNIIQDLSLKDYLSKNMSNYKNRKERFEKLSKYLLSHMHQHKFWAYKFFFCEVMNLVIVVAVVHFLDWFLNGEFKEYGIKVIEMIGQDPETRNDPMSYVFPRVAKCSFKMFGASGTIETRDIMCLIATNIINEKIFVFLWVWLSILIAVTSMWLVYRLMTIVSAGLREKLLKHQAPHTTSNQIDTVMSKVSLSDWLLLCHLGKNMDNVVFSEFITQFAREINPTKEKSLEMEHLVNQQEEA